MNTNLGHLTIELIIGFVALFLLTKVLGKTHINQLTPFDFISSIVLGELLGNAVYDKEINLFYIMYALTLWGLIMFSIEKILAKYNRSRNLLLGNPSIIVRQGQVEKELLRKNRIDINQLQNMLRQKDVFSIREVDYAILESNGSLSVMKKSKYDNPTADDFDLPDKKRYLAVSLILDGKIDHENLNKLEKDRDWLLEEVRAEGYRGIEDIFYGEWLENEGLHLIPIKQKNKGVP